METLPVARQNHEIVNLEDSAMSVETLTRQVNLIQGVMKNVMKENEHYGVIPSTDKPTLLKPGAEKLCLTFRLDPDYEIIREVREKDFIAYTVKCSLKHIPTGQAIASGIGACNSRETKYRYRSQNTGKPVPKEYWDTRDSAILGGSQYKPQKKDKQWFIFEQVEHDNPWDFDNTLIKMACKRALVAATLNATAASDIFTQDVEDMPKEIISGGQAQPKPDTTPPPAKPERAASNDTLTEKQYNFIAGKATKAGLTESELKNFIIWYKKTYPSAETKHGEKPTSTEKGNLSKSGASAIIDGFDDLLSNYQEAQMSEFEGLNEGTPEGGPPTQEDDIPF